MFTIKLKLLFASVYTLSLAFVFSFFLHGTNASASETSWSVTYYPTDHLTGTPVAASAVSVLNFNWGMEAPNSKIPKDNFSAKFEKKLTVSQSGSYTFSGRVDDGIRIYVDGVKKYEYWKDGVRDYSANISLTAGTHTIRVDYYDRGGKAAINLAITPPHVQPATPTDKWLATFYPTDHLTGSPVNTYYSELNEAWAASPIAGIPTDNFSATFERKYAASSTGIYTFSGRVDDGIRIYVDGVKKYELWKDGVRDYSANISLSAGTHTIKLEYYDRVGRAAINLAITPPHVQPAIPTDKWLATFYPTDHLTGSPVNTYYSELNEAWAASPIAGIPANNFSAKFERKYTASKAGIYTFSGRVDDGIRIYVDGAKKYELWKDGVRNFTSNINLSAGTHTIKVEYYNRGGKAAINLDITPPHVQPAIPSDKWLATYYPTDHLAGAPVNHYYADLNLAWAAVPVAGIPAANFSAKFERKYTSSTAGTYTFSGRVDDGIRIYVDGVKKYEYWKDGVRNFTSNIYLSAGTHTIKVEYYDRGGKAAINMNIAPPHVQPAIPSDKWLATYYPTDNLTGTPVNQYYNDLNLSWAVSPIAGIPSDNFSASFERKWIAATTDTYTFSGRVDDGIRIYVDGVKKYEYWKDGVRNFTADIALTAGTHTIRVEYYGRGGKAAINLDIKKQHIQPEVTSDKWMATYYPTIDFGGDPINQYYSDINFSWSASPIEGMPADNFSATFERKLLVTETTKYRFSGRVDDGIRIYVDGVKKYEIWKDGVRDYSTDITMSAGNHDIKIEYYDTGSNAGITLNMEPVSATDSWSAYYYPSSNLTGTPAIDMAENLNFSWGSSPPAPQVSVSNFSARFTKIISVPLEGKYKFSGQVGNGIRIIVDNATILDNWTTGQKNINTDVNLTSGLHTIEVQYFNSSSQAVLDLNLDRMEIKKVSQTTAYSYTLQSAVDKQVKYASPQTDKSYDTYVNAGAFSSVTTSGSTTTGIVGPGSNWNVRSGTDTSSWIFGVIKPGQKVTILSDKIKAANGGDWYKISYNSWKDAPPTDVKSYMDPNNIAASSPTFYQFLKLSGSAGTNAYEVNSTILTAAKAGVLSGKAQVYQQASLDYNINEVYLISHSLLETGNGKSVLATGVKVKYKLDSNGQKIYVSGKPQVSVVTSGSYDAIVYNMYGIGAKDSCPLDCGAQKAFDEGWFSVDAAIRGGAQFVAENYVFKGQDTLYKMRWNPEALSSGNPTHQYATDIGWASKQTTRFYELYSMLESYTAVFDVPEYLN
ncbi:PA14 domain-containing protein [Peribacillus kribbensis]|uniref:PA14 domain-containing protein n=1 Tax=Peribacillus kribbensis TaxID=356658 RepID=UPI00040725CB|nr:PA14 domain-containing protein [Peribacillus kribbensis]